MPSWDGLFDRESLYRALEVLIKLGLGAIFGSIIGWERELHGRPAGMRTHMLVCIGVVMFAEASKFFGGEDSSRIAAQIVTGIGFLGAGAIIRTAGEIKGLTTAASIWAIASIGMAVSVGGAFYIVAFVGMLMTLFTLSVVDNLEKKFLIPRLNEMIVKAEKTSVFSQLARELEDKGANIISSSIQRLEQGYQIRIETSGMKSEWLETASSIEGVISASWRE